jgi:hypothetical protein
MRRLVLLLLLSLGVTASAEALTIRDVIELTRAGLGDEVLLALIEVDRRVYTVDTKTLKELKLAGVSDKVIAALVRSGRELPVQPPPAAPVEEEPEAPAPQVVVIDHHDEREVREVAVPYPVYIPVVSTHPGVHVPRRHRVTTPTVDPNSNFIPFQSGPPIARPVAETPKAPVYWGFGGKLRPDAWNPEPPKPQQHRNRRRDK